MPKLNTTTSGIITATLTADSSPTLELQQNGVAIRTLGESQLVMGTAQSTATGATAYDFTGIPSWAKRITIMFNGVSTSGTSQVQVQLGDSGGFETSGYSGGSSYASTNGANSAGFTIEYSGGPLATTVRSGILTICLLGSNTWCSAGIMNWNGPSISSAGAKTLSDTLTQVRITTVNGTDTFDAGTVNIMWE